MAPSNLRRHPLTAGEDGIGLRRAAPPLSPYVESAFGWYGAPLLLSVRRVSISFARMAMQASIACSSRCGTRNPSLPEVIISGVAPIVLAMTGRPAPIASITETGQPRRTLHWVAEMHRRSDSSLRTSVSGSVPVNVTCDCKPESRIAATIASW